MHRRRFVWISVLAAALVTAVAGAATAADKSSKDMTLNLVAYSTPRPVLDKLIAEFRKTPQGSDINFRASYGPPGPGPGRRQRAACRRGHPQHGQRHQDLVVKGLINKNWDKQSYNGVVWNSVVVFGLRDGNPKKIKGWNDLLKPGRRHRHGEPVHGRDREVEHPRRLRCAAEARQDRQAGDRLPPEVLQEQRRLAGLVRVERDERVPLRQRRRPPHVRERSDQREDPVRHPAPDDAHRRLHRRPREERAQDRVERVLALPQDLSGPEDPRRVRLPPVNKQAINEFQKQVPGPARQDEDQHTLLGGWRAVDKKWFDPKRASCSGSSRRTGCPLASTVTEAPGLPAPATHRRERASTALSLQVASSRRSCSSIVVLPIAAAHLAVDRQWLVRFLGGRLDPQAVAALKLSWSCRRWRCSRPRLRHDHRLGAGRDYFARQVHRQRDHRPAVRAADDRRRARAPRPLRPADADRLHDRLVSLRRERDVHARRDLPRAAVRDPAVRRPDGAARAHRARQEIEDASRSLGASEFTTFRRIVLPSILPGILSGVAMAFARAVGEIGAIVLIAGILPFKTEVASIHLFHRIERTRRARPRSPSCCC